MIASLRVWLQSVDYISLSQEDCKALEADDNWKWLCDGLQKSRSVIKLCAEFSQKCLHSLYAYIKLFERLMSISAIIGHGSVLVFTSYYRCWMWNLSALLLMEMDIKNFPFSSFKCLSRSLGTFNVQYFDELMYADLFGAAKLRFVGWLAFKLIGTTSIFKAKKALDHPSQTLISHWADRNLSAEDYIRLPAVLEAMRSPLSPTRSPQREREKDRWSLYVTPFLFFYHGPLI